MPRLAELALHGRGEALEVALQHVVAGTGPHGRHGPLLADGPRDEDEGQLGIVIADDGQSLGPAEPRQAVVAEDDVPGLLPESAEQLVAAPDHLGLQLHAGSPQLAYRQLGVVGRVLDHQESDGGGVHGAALGGAWLRRSQ